MARAWLDRPPALPAGSRPWLVAASALSALGFGWAALALPWRPVAPLGLLAWGLAVLHLCASGMLAVRPDRSRRALLALAVASLGAAPVFVYAIGSTSVQMIQMFGALGRGLAVALGAIGWLLLLGTLPLGLFFLWVARRPT